MRTTISAELATSRIGILGHVESLGFQGMCDGIALVPHLYDQINLFHAVVFLRKVMPCSISSAMQDGTGDVR